MRVSLGPITLCHILQPHVFEQLDNLLDLLGVNRRDQSHQTVVLAQNWFVLLLVRLDGRTARLRRGGRRHLREGTASVHLRAAWLQTENKNGRIVSKSCTRARTWLVH